MASSSKPTPEEKLFAVIQGAAHQPIRRSRAATWPLLTARVAAAIGPLDLPRVNQLLMGIAAMLALLCVGTPLVMRPSVAQIIAAVGPQPIARIPKPLEGLKALEEYQQVLQTQDPFRIADVPAPAPVTEVSPPPPPNPRALLGDVKLVGISWGPQPVAMIEQNAQTFFLKAGDLFGTLTVKEVLQDRVIFRAGEQDVELE